MSPCYYPYKSISCCSHHNEMEWLSSTSPSPYLYAATYPKKPYPQPRYFPNRMKMKNSTYWYASYKERLFCYQKIL